MDNQLGERFESKDNMECILLCGILQQLPNVNKGRHNIQQCTTERLFTPGLSLTRPHHVLVNGRRQKEHSAVDRIASSDYFRIPSIVLESLGSIFYETDKYNILKKTLYKFLLLRTQHYSTIHTADDHHKMFSMQFVFGNCLYFFSNMGFF